MGYFMKFKRQRPLLVLAITMLLLTTYNLHIYKEKEAEAEIESLQLQMNAGIDRFDAWIREYVSDLELIRSHIEQYSITELRYAKTNNRYLTYAFSDDLKYVNFIGFANGDFVSSSEWFPPDTYDPRFRPWYIKASSENRTILSNVYVDFITNNYVISICTPLHIRHTFVGVLGTVVDLSLLNTTLIADKENGFIDYFVLDSRGLILADTSSPASINQMSKSPYSEFLRNSVSSEHLKYSYIQDNILYVYEYDPDTNWLIGSKFDLSNSPFKHSILNHPQLIVNFILILFFMFTLHYMYKLHQELLQTTSTLETQNESQKALNQKLEEVNNQLAYRAIHDGLTGLYNRFAFDDMIDKLITRGFQERKHIGLILFDIDDFKAYNDIYGHVQGDNALKQISHEALEYCTNSVMVARYGGEEFAVLFYEQDIDEIYEIAKGLVAHIRSLNIEHKLSDTGFVTISGGANAILPSLTTSRGKFIHHADTALYQAKSQGKNQMVKAYLRT